MNLRDLHYFVALAEHKHFGKAAKSCFISQPSLSIQIKKLEAYLGVDLFERTSRSVLLTDIGKIVAEQARTLLQQASSIKEITKQAQDPFSGELKIGIIPTLSSYLLPHLLPELVKTESFPKLSVYLSELQSTTIIAKIHKGDLDAGLVALPANDDNLVVHSLFVEELLLAVSNQHALAKKKFIKTINLTKYPLLLLEEGHCLRDQALALGSIQEDKKISATSLEVLKFMVGLNIGITLMPFLACKPTDGLLYLPFKSPKLKRTIGMIWRKSSPKTLLLEKLKEHVVRLTKALHCVIY